MSTVADTLASVKFALTVVVLVALACVVGTLLPQGADVRVYLDQHPEAVARMEWLGRFGFTHLFSAWWFLGLLCLLAASVAVCSARRFATVRRTTGHARGRAFGSMTTHISILLILTGAVIRGVWGVRGVLELREGETTAQFLTETGARTLPFAIHLRDFTVEHYDDVPGKSQREQVAGAGPIKAFRSTLQVVENGSVVRQKTIEVNAPLFHKGWRFYQSGYNPQDLSWTSLQVVRDPGVPVVYAGFSLMIVGLAIVFYTNPWLDTRRKRSTPS